MDQAWGKVWWLACLAHGRINLAHVLALSAVCRMHMHACLLLGSCAGACALVAICCQCRMPCSQYLVNNLQLL